MVVVDVVVVMAVVMAVMVAIVVVFVGDLIGVGVYGCLDGASIHMEQTNRGK